MNGMAQPDKTLRYGLKWTSNASSAKGREKKGKSSS
jgi:hypothetical protein